MYYIKDFWVTKEFEKIKISEMKTNHIENTIRFLKNIHAFMMNVIVAFVIMMIIVMKIILI